MAGKISGLEGEISLNRKTVVKKDAEVIRAEESVQEVAGGMTYSVHCA